MSGRRGEISREQQRAIGGAVRASRAAGVAWKVLEQRYDRCRSQLWRYAVAAAAQDATQFLKDATSRPLPRAAGAPEIAGSGYYALTLSERPS